MRNGMIRSLAQNVGNASPSDPIVQGALLRSLERYGELSVASLRALSPLSDKAQILVDKAVVEVGLQRLTVTADIMAAGLTFPLSDPLSVTQIEWESVNQTGGAQRTMTPAARGEFQMPNRTINRLPIYLTTDDFSIGIRTLKMSQRVGQPLDLSLVKQATRRVNEGIEDATINGATDTTGANLQVGGYPAPGLLNAPNANTYVYSGGGTNAWDNVAKTGQQIFDDVQAMANLAIGDLKFGPFNLYIPVSYAAAIEKDFKTNVTGSIRQRLAALEYGGRPINIRTADLLPANKTVLVQMSDDVVEMVMGQTPTVIPWTSVDGFTLYWMVMAIMVPRVRSDYNGASGIVIGFTA